jgi:dUTP pyrophosphatase
MNDEIYFSKVRPDAIIPSKRDEDGAFDIYANFEEESITIEPNEIKLIPTGIKSVFDKKYRFVFQERGSTGVIGMKVNAGLIDSGYRNEWFVCLNNTSKKTIIIDKKVQKTEVYDKHVHYPYTKAICQAKLDLVPVVTVKEISDEEYKSFKSERGEGALGSSGK